MWNVEGSKITEELLSFNNFICDCEWNQDGERGSEGKEKWGRRIICTHLERKLNYRLVRILNTPAPIPINLQLSENHICVHTLPCTSRTLATVEASSGSNDVGEKLKNCDFL